MAGEVSPRENEACCRPQKSAFSFCIMSFKSTGGRHTCLGEHFGYLQIKTILAVLLQNFELELTNGLPQPDFGAMIVGPATSGVRYKRIPKRF